tara:strand:- start:46 stop:351 length:306 start_codon:yes stop_codon:yes gene_type:complete
VAARKYDKEYYESNKDKIGANNKAYKLKIRKWFREYKKKLKCLKCSETHWACLEFHHVSKRKDGAVSNMVGQGYGKDRILKEISKCEVLCANCHRKVHHKL